MKELVAGNYFAKKNLVLLYLVIEGVGTFLKITKSIVLENPTVYSEEEILFNFQSDPSSFTIIEEANIWPKPEPIEIKTIKPSKKPIRNVVLPEDSIAIEIVPLELSESEINNFKEVSEAEGRDATIDFISKMMQVSIKVAEVTYNKYI